MKQKSDIGLIGLAVMGENLVLNMAGKGFRVAVYNRTTAKVDTFLAGRAKGLPISGFHHVGDFAEAIERPRKVMMMLKAGEAVDQFIGQLLIVLNNAVVHNRNTAVKAHMRMGVRISGATVCCPSGMSDSCGARIQRILFQRLPQVVQASGLLRDLHTLGARDSYTRRVIPAVLETRESFQYEIKRAIGCLI